MFAKKSVVCAHVVVGLVCAACPAGATGGAGLWLRRYTAHHEATRRYSGLHR
jgi:hypothetical protein